MRYCNLSLRYRDCHMMHSLTYHHNWFAPTQPADSPLWWVCPEDGKRKGVNQYFYFSMCEVFIKIIPTSVSNDLQTTRQHNKGLVHTFDTTVWLWLNWIWMSVNIMSICLFFRRIAFCEWFNNEMFTMYIKSAMLKKKKIKSLGRVNLVWSP